MSEPREWIIVGLGELLWDVFDGHRRPGGAPANVAFHAQQMGLRGIVCSRVGADDLGSELLDFLARQGLDERYVQRDEEHPTGVVTVDLSRPDEPDYVIHENVAWDHIRFDDDVRALMQAASAVCFGTLAQRSPESRETIHKCLESASDAVLVYDVNLRQKWYDRSWVELSLERCHIAKLNLDEARVLGDLLELPTGEPVDFARAAIERYELRMVCVTRAEKGCLLVTRDETVDEPGKKVAVADAVGAGDAFTAALISGYLRGWRPGAVAAFANSVGALVASRARAMPVLRDEYAALIEQFAQVA